MNKNQVFDRREFLKTAAVAAGVASLPNFAFAQAAKIRIGLMLPYSGTYAALGAASDVDFAVNISKADDYARQSGNAALLARVRAAKGRGR